MNLGYKVMKDGDSKTKLLQELIAYAAPAAISCLVLFRIFDPILKATMEAIKQHNNRNKELGRLNSLFQTNPYDVDRISELPDEILSRISSFLTFKEAFRTTVLSKRWKHAWAYVPNLDFDAHTNFSSGRKMVDVKEYVEKLIRERPLFVNWVNKVLQSHQGLVLNSFRIHCYFGYSFMAELDGWLQYAFDRRVQCLEVNLSSHWLDGFPDDEYAFNYTCFDHRNWDSLKELVLKNVNISTTTLEFLLENCKNLESLVLHSAKDLITLEVCDPSLALKHLEIEFCPLKFLTISNVNLISLKIWKPGVLKLNNVPQLTSATFISSNYAIEDVVRGLSCCFSKLKDLSLLLVPRHARQYNWTQLPQLPALKQLSLHLWLHTEESMFGVTSFFRASPNLEKFAIKLEYPLKIETIRKSEEDVVNYPLQHLRVVEISQYRGRSIELELIKYFLENAISLEKIIVDPRYETPESYGGVWWWSPEGLSREAEVTNEARRCAKQQLLEGMTSHFTLEIL